MAFDPDQFLAETAPQPASGGFDPDQFLKDTEPKSLAGFGKNVWEDVKGTVGGLGQLGKGLVEHPIDTTVHVAKNVVPSLIEEGKRIGIGEMLTGHPIRAGEKFVDAAYNKPLTTALDVLPAASAAGKGIGAVGRALGVGGKAAELGEVAGTAAKAAPGMAEMMGQRVVARTTSGALNLNPNAVGRLARKAGITPEQTVLNIGEKVDRLLPDLVKATDNANIKFDKVLNAHDASGQALGGLVKETTAKSGGILPEARKTIKALKKAAADYDQLDGGELALKKAASRLEKLKADGKLDFDRLSKFKSEIGKGFGKSETPAGTSEVYGILSDGIDDVINRVSVQNPVMAEQFANLKEIYNVTSNMLPAMAKTAAKEVAGGSLGGGLMGKVTPGIVGGIIGGLPGAIVGTGAKYLQEAIAPDLLKNLGYIGMKKAGRVGAPLARIGARMPNPRVAGGAAIGNIGLKQNENDELEKYLSSKYGQGGAQ